MSARGRRLVVRPSIPPASWLACGVWAGALLAEESSWRVYTRAAPAIVVWAVLGAAAVSAAVALASRRRVGVTLLLMGLAVGTVAGCAYWAWWRAASAAAEASGAVEWHGIATDDPAPALGGARVSVRLASGGALSLMWPGGLPPPEMGRVVRFRATVRRFDVRSAYARTAARRGELGEARAWAATEEGWRPGPLGWMLSGRSRVSREIDRIRGPGGDLLAAVLLGDTRRIAGTPVEQDFRVAGLAHVRAASALYVGVLCAVVLWAVRRAGAPRWAQVSLALALGIAYACASGIRASMVRCLLAFAGASAAALVGRRRDPLATLGLAIAGMIVVSPPAATDLGLAIGVLAVVGLCLFGGLARRWVATVLPDRMARMAPALAAAAVVQVSVLPATAGAFGILPLLAPASAVAVVPLACAALPVGLAGAAGCLIWPAIALPALRLAAGMLAACAGTAAFIASRPGAAVPLGAMGPAASVAFAAAAFGVWAWWPQPSRRRSARWIAALAALVLAFYVVGPPVRGGAEVVVMDVGQGDAILVRDGAATMLVDTGPDLGVLRAALARQGVRRVDCVVLTHAHADHTGGLPGLAGVATVGWVGTPEVATPDAFAGPARAAERLTPPRSDRMRVLKAGDSWRLGATDVRVLWPQRADPTLSPNDTSVVLLLRRGAFAILLTGDGESHAQEGVLAQGVVPRLDVLKVAHHGSSNGCVDSPLQAWAPRLALVSVGVGNDFGHPAPSTLRRLAEMGATIHRTDLEGDLVTTLGATLSFSAARGGSRVACETIRGAPARIEATGPPRAIERTTKPHGDQRPGGPEAGLPHIRRRAVAAGARGPPPEVPAAGGRRPRLQLRRVRRRQRRHRRDTDGRQHVAVHVGEAARGGA